LEQAAAALWLLVQLGGVGSRSRRLGGSLSATASVEHGGLEFALNGASAAAVANELASGLRQVRSIMAKYYAAARALSQSPAFDILEPVACSVWVLDMYDRWETASEAVGSALRSFRVATQGAAATVPSLRERAVFGLPLRGVSITPSQIDRRASPLWLKLSKTRAGRYVAVATLFKSQFLPGDVQLNGSAPPRGYELIERWIEGKFPKRAEVRYD
jgi:CRISPR-associated protein Cmr1